MNGGQIRQLHGENSVKQSKIQVIGNTGEETQIATELEEKTGVTVKGPDSRSGDSKDIDAVILTEVDELESLETRQATVILFLKQNTAEAVQSIARGEAEDLVLNEGGSLSYRLLEQRVKQLLHRRSTRCRARDMLERIDDAFFSLDTDFNIQYVNEKCQRFLRKSSDELLERNLWEVFPEARDSRFEQEYRKAIDQQDSRQFEEYYPPLEKWFSVRAFPSNSGLSVYFNDITDRKQWEKQLGNRLRQQEATTNLLRMALEERDIVQLQQKAAQKVAVNTGNDFAKVLQFDRDSGKLVLGACYGIDSSRIGKPVKSDEGCLQSDASFSSREPVVVEDFNESEYDRSNLLKFLNVRSGIATVIGEVESPWGVLCTHSVESRSFSKHEVNFVQGVANIIASAVDSEEQRTRYMEYERAMDALQQGIAVFDENCRFLVANEAFEEMVGFETEELRGRKKHCIKSDYGGSRITALIESSSGEKLEFDASVSDISLPTGSRGKVAKVKSLRNLG